MDTKNQSTGNYVLVAMEHDPEVKALLEQVGRLYGSESLLLVQGVIEQNLSTSTLTDEYGHERPPGIEFFKFELNELISRKKTADS